MSINLPSNCNKENQKISYGKKLYEIVRLKHNNDKLGTTDKMVYKLNEVMELIDNAIEIVKQENMHGMNIEEHIVDDIINFPTGVRPKLGVEVDYANNEGARYSALISLAIDAETKGMDLMINKDYTAKLIQAEKDCINNIYWNPKIEDIT